MRNIALLASPSGMPPVLLAPMAGVTDGTFRALCRAFGATATITEMVSAKALCFSDAKSHALCVIKPQERPCSIQLFGHEPAVLARAVQLVERHAPDGIDINMGCPVHKVVGGGDGSALMRSPTLIFEIVTAVRQATDLPVSVKLRTGIDGVTNAVECALAAQQGGADFVMVHGRLREQYYRPGVDVAAIAAVKTSLRIPVLANGDVSSPETAQRLLRDTGADGLLVGRAAHGNPFLFARIAASLSGGAPPPLPSVEQRLVVALDHIEALCAAKGQKVGMLEARGHLMAYLTGMRGASVLRERCGQITTMQHVTEILRLAAAYEAREVRPGE